MSPLGNPVVPARVDALLKSWQAEEPDLFWAPTRGSQLLLDKRKGVVATLRGGAAVGYGGMRVNQQGSSANAQYLHFGTTLGILANYSFFGMLLVDVPDPANVTGCFLKIGANGSDGVGFGAGNTTFEDAGSKLVHLREGIAWHVSSSGNAFVRGLNVLSIYWNAVVSGDIINMSTGIFTASGALNYNTPTDGIGINGYLTNRTSNATVRAVALWAATYTGAEAIAKRARLAAPLLPLAGRVGPEWFTPRKVWLPVSAGGGSTGAVSLIHGLTRANLTSGRLVA